jgi:hypothetical protein
MSAATGNIEHRMPDTGEASLHGDELKWTRA